MADLAVQAVTGVDAVSVVNMIISSARKAAAHQRNCEQLAEHVKMIGNLLEKLKSTDLVSLPAIKEPLDCLEESLKKALDLVESCRDKSYLYMLAMGWSVVYQFRQVQVEIDRYLKLVPLISLVHEFRMQVSCSNIFFCFCFLTENALIVSVLRREPSTSVTFTGIWTVQYMWVLKWWWGL